jgi:8-oxo-dGTP diphosphatase
MSGSFVIRCRGIVVNDGRLLVVVHPHDTSFAALPGGKLEPGEGIKECMTRELNEELGVEADIGRLLFVNRFMDREAQSVEFFFEIKNSADFVGWEKRARSHADELVSVRWVAPTDEVRILPEAFAVHFRDGTLVGEEPRFISG